MSGAVSLAFKLFAIDEASPVFNRVAKSAEASGAAVERAGTAHSRASAAVTSFANKGSAAAVLVGGASLKMAADFQEGLTSLVTGAGESEKKIGMVGNGIKSIAVQTGTSTKQLTDGMFMIESAGFHGKAGLDVLKNAAMGAKVGNASLGVTADAVTTLMKDYAGSNVTASQATNGLISTVKQGKTHMQDLAGSLAKVAPAASAAGISMKETLGAMATLTSRGVPAAMAATGLKSTIINLVNPSKAAAKAMAEIGISSSDISTEMRKKGLVATLETLTDAMGKKMGPSGALFIDTLKKSSTSTTGFQKALQKGTPAQREQVAQLAQMMGGTRSLQAALVLTSKSGLKDFKDKTEAIGEATKHAHGGIEGWKEVQKDFNFQLDKFRATAEVLMITLGQKLLPVFTFLLKAMIPILPVIAGIVGALLAMSVIVKVVTLVQRFVEIMKTYAVISRICTAAQWAWNAAMDANPIVLIVIGIGILIAAIVMIATKTTWFQSIWKFTWNQVKGVFDFVAAGLKLGFTILVNYLRFVWNAFMIWIKLATAVYMTAFKLAWNVAWTAIKLVAEVVWTALKFEWQLFWIALKLYMNLGLAIIKTTWSLAWIAVKLAGELVWTAIKLAFQVFMNVIKLEMQVAMAVIKTAWSLAWVAIRLVATVAWAVIRAGFAIFSAAFKLAFRLMCDVFTGNWSGAWNDIKKFASAVWGALRALFGTFSGAMKTAMSGMLNALRSGWSQAWNAIKNFANSIWGSIRNAFGAFSSALKKALSGMMGALKSGWSSGWKSIKSAAESVWNALRKAFGSFSSAFKTATKGLMSAMSSAWKSGASAIGKAWASIKKLTRDPIQAIVNVVYNNGIVKLWNGVAGVFGGKKIGNFHLPAFKQGGPIIGAGTGTSDSIVARVSHGEHVWTADEVAGAGGHGNVARIRSHFSRKEARAIGNNGKFALGGGIHIPGTNIDVPNPVDVVKNAAKATFDAAKGFGGDILGELKKLALGGVSAVVNPMLDTVQKGGIKLVDAAVPGKGLPLEVMAEGVIKKMISTIKSWITAKDSVGGGDIPAAIKFADAQIGKPYQYGGGMDPSFDCSSFMSSIAKVILGKDPHGREWSTMDFQGKQAPKGWTWHKNSAFMIGVTNGPNGSGGKEGHTAGTLAGVNYEATPPVLRKGPGARGYQDPMFTDWYGFDAGTGGGVIPTGQHKAIIDAAMAAAGVSGGAWEAGLNTIITRESNWNASAVNTYDSNAFAGTPSKGLAQVIDPTFAAYHVAGTSGNILDPVANIAAAIRYIQAVYGGIGNVQQADASKPPKGYRFGGLPGMGLSVVGENGPEFLFNGRVIPMPRAVSHDLSPRSSSPWTPSDRAGSGSMDLGTLVLHVKGEDGKTIEKKLVKVKQGRGGRKLQFEEK